MRVGHEDAVPDNRLDAGNDAVRHGVGTMRAIVADGYGTAAEIVRAVEPIPGGFDVTAERVTGLPVIRVQVDRDALARHGVARRRP
jgi:hypothetical protein